MNEDVKTQFVNALMSGEYPQIKGRLHDEVGGVCANGLLCELAIQNGLNVQRVIGGYAVDRGTWVQYSGCFGPPTAVMDWAGIDEKWSQFLARLNDTGYTFQEIGEQLKHDSSTSALFRAICAPKGEK